MFALMRRAALAVVLATLATETATAQTPQCDRLARQLASASSGGGGGGSTGPWSAAANAQRAELARAQSELARAGCGGFFGDPGVCSGLQGRVQQMRANLSRLESGATRREGGSGRDAGAIRAEMARLGCGTARAGQPAAAPPSQPQMGFIGTSGGIRSFVAPGPGGVPYLYREDSSGRITMVGPAGSNRGAEPTPAAARPQSNPPGFIDSLFGFRRPADGNEPLPPSDYVDGGLGGSYRTICVRACDGYFFPISFSASPSRFDMDSKICEAMCPSGNARLFVHRNPGEEAEQAVSADTKRTPITKIPNAFKYRDQVVESCTCGQPTQALKDLIESDKASRSKEKKPDDRERPDMSVPGLKPVLDDDPDSQANTAADFTPGRALTPSTPMAAQGARKVRIVGPSYFYAR